MIRAVLYQSPNTDPIFDFYQDQIANNRELHREFITNTPNAIAGKAIYVFRTPHAEAHDDQFVASEPLNRYALMVRTEMANTRIPFDAPATAGSNTLRFFSHIEDVAADLQYQLKVHRP